MSQIYSSLGTVKDYLADSLPNWPDNLIPLDSLPGDMLDQIYVLYADINHSEAGVQCGFGFTFEEQLGFSLPGFSCASIVVGGLHELDEQVESHTDDNGFTIVNTTLYLGERSCLRFHDIRVAVRLDSEQLKPVATDPETAPPEHVDIDVFGDLEVNSDLDFNVYGFNALNLPPVMIGNSGIIISAENVNPDFINTDPKLSIAKADVQFSDGSLISPDLLGKLPHIAFTNATINGQGFSGSVSAEWPLVYNEDENLFQYRIATRNEDGSFALDKNGDPIEAVENAEIFGIRGGFSHIALTFEQNQLVNSDITGQMLIPYFDEAVNIRLNIGEGGVFTITLVGVSEEGITLTKEELLALTIQSISLTNEGAGAIAISGELEPLLMASDGLEWPKLSVEGLSIDGTGKLKIQEAWLDLKELATLDLWGFQLQLSRLGLGLEEPTDKMWLDLSGDLRLMEQIPIGVGVEGFRLAWPRTLYHDLGIEGVPTLSQMSAIASALEVKFDGINLFYSVPKAVEFEGFIEFIKEPQKVGFAGDVALRIPAVGFALEAGLLIGMNFAKPPYPFLYTYMGVELPQGIPLGQSGLALKGALGLFGINVYPDVLPEQNMYNDWYKLEPVGAHQATKWTDRRGGLATGIGVTITTTDGYIKSVRGLLVLALPGPLLLLEGRALFLGTLGADSPPPPLRALACFNGEQKTVQFNVEAEKELIDGLVRAHGTVETFFDFKRLTNWHFYLGQNKPDDLRVQAKVFKLDKGYLLDGTGYFMMDMVQQDMVQQETIRSRMGIYADFSPDIPDFDPIKISVGATIKGNGEITLLPEQFSGDLAMAASIEVSAFDFGETWEINVKVNPAKGPKPFEVEAELTVEVELPDPLEDFDETFTFKWPEDNQSGNPTPMCPLDNIILNSDFCPGDSVLSIRDSDDLSHFEIIDSPIVPLDAHPLLVFKYDMECDIADSKFVRDPNTKIKTYKLGDKKYTSKLTEVKLYRCATNEASLGNLDSWELVESTSNGAGDIWGIWLADADLEDPSAPATRRLRLWTMTPFLLNSGSDEAHNGGVLEQSDSDYYKCPVEDLQKVCIDFEDAEEIEIAPEKMWHYKGYEFSTDGRLDILTFESYDRTTIPVVPRNTRLPLIKLLKKEMRRGALSDNATNAELRRVARMIPKARRTPLRRLEPNWHEIWDWLWAPAVSEKVCLCMRGNKYEIAFPEFTREAWIDFFPLPGDGLKGLTDGTKALHDGNEVNVSLDINARVLHIEGDPGFSEITIDLNEDIAIEKICCITVGDFLQHQNVTEQCESTSVTMSYCMGKSHSFEPGYCYCLQVGTEAKPVNSGTKKEFSKMAFFQTESPPTDLTNYVKWSYPAAQETNIYRNDTFSIRFLRSYVQTLYDAPRHQLQLQIRDMQGQIVPGYETIWENARSRTLLLLEELFYKRLLNYDMISADDFLALPKDEVIKLRHSGEPSPLKPQSRYDLLLIGGEGGNLLFSNEFGFATLEATWETTHSWLIDQANRELRCNEDTDAGAFIYTGDRSWADVDIAIKFKDEGDGSVGIVFRDSLFNDSGEQVQQRYVYVLSREAKHREFTLITETTTSTDTLSLLTESVNDADLVYKNDEYHRLRVSAISNHIQAWLDGNQVLNVEIYKANEAVGNFTKGTIVTVDRSKDVPSEIISAIDAGNLMPAGPLQGRIGLHAVSKDVAFRSLKVRDAVLLRIPFTTSAFEGICNHIHSNGHATVRSPELPTSLVTACEDSLQPYAEAKADWEKARIDYVYGHIDRESLEGHRLELREKAAILDLNFRILCETISSELYYAPLADTTEVYIIRHEDDMKPLGFWIRSPEPLNWRMELNSKIAGWEHIGDLTCDILGDLLTLIGNILVEPYKVCTIHNSDTTQTIALLPDNLIGWLDRIYKIKYEYIGNPGDEYLSEPHELDVDDNSFSHRYDRPIRESPGTSDPLECKQICPLIEVSKIGLD